VLAAPVARVRNPVVGARYATYPEVAAAPFATGLPNKATPSFVENVAVNSTSVSATRLLIGTEEKAKFNPVALLGVVIVIWPMEVKKSDVGAVPVMAKLVA
jgi:hypothetical protein